MNPSAMTGAVQDKFAMMEPNPPDFQLSPSIQPYVKLHGSVNWMESNTGQRMLIMGGAKTALIGRFPLLKWYQDEFRKALMQPGARLMVMGYSFSDEHINDAIFTAATPEVVQHEVSVSLGIVGHDGWGTHDKILP
jgi:hypothetical protein